MLKQVLLISALSLSSLVFSQSKFEIKQFGKKYSTEQVVTAFEAADLCGSFYASKRNVLKMDDGTVLELKSAREIQSAGIELRGECILPEATVYYDCIWSIAENGLLLKGFQTEKYKSEKEYKHVNHEN